MRAQTKTWFGLGLALFACDSGGSDGEQVAAKVGEAPAGVDAAKSKSGAAKPGAQGERPANEDPSPSEPAPVEAHRADETPVEPEASHDAPTVGAALGPAVAGAMSGTAMSGPLMKTGDDDKPVSARQSLFVRADGSGEPVTGMHLRDPGQIAKRLGLHVVPSRFGTAMAIRKDAKPTLKVSGDKGTARVEILSKHVTTPAGVAVGMRYDDIVAKVPGARCRAEAGADGEFLHCEVDVGVFAAIEAPKGVGDDWDDSVLEPAEANKLAGKAEVSSLEVWYSDVPEPGSTTEVVTALVHETGALPAGLSWNGDTYSVCDTEPAPQRCHRPRAAVVTGIFAVAEMEAKLAAVDREGLAPGYPLVVHTDELELESADREGIAIVLGLFARPDAAEAWSKTHSGTEVLPITAQPLTEGSRTRVGQLRSGSVRAYANDELGQIDHGVDPGKPVCKLPGDALVVFEADQGVVYASVPVACPDGTEAFVRWWDTMMFTTVGEDAQGKATVWQLVGAECDQPRFAHWRWADGARTGQPTIVEGDAC